MGLHVARKCLSSVMRFMWTTSASHIIFTAIALLLILFQLGFDHSWEPLPSLSHVCVHIVVYIALEAKAGSYCIIHSNAVILSNWTHEAGEVGDTLSLCLFVETVLIIIGDLWVWSVQTSRWSSPSEATVDTDADGDGKGQCMGVYSTHCCIEAAGDEIYWKYSKYIGFDWID